LQADDVPKGKDLAQPDLQRQYSMRGITTADALASVKALSQGSSVQAAESAQLQRNGYVVTAGSGRIQPWQSAEEVGRLGQQEGQQVFQRLDSELEIHVGQRRMLVLQDLVKIVQLWGLAKEAEAEGICLPDKLPMCRNGKVFTFNTKALSSWEAPAQGVKAWQVAAGPSTAEGAGASVEDSTMVGRPGVKRRSGAAKTASASANNPSSSSVEEDGGWLRFSPKQLELVSVRSRGAALAQDYSLPSLIDYS
jgi:hypothetical protein